jgi:hypothetical protein
MTTVTYFKGLKSTKPEKTVEIADILDKIRNGEWKDKVVPCRENIALKDKLPCFTPTGIFNHRSIAGLETYNGIICLDIDHVADPEDLKSRCKNLDWVRAAFVTPSGKGLKVIVQTQATVETYKQTELQVAEAFLEATGVARDNRCKDIARIQYVSYDPELYYNPDSLTF